MIKLSRRVVILYWLIGILGVLCILGNLHKDRFSYESVTTELQYHESFEEKENGLGVLVEGKELSLKRGTYTLEADLASQFSGDELVVCAKTAVSEENVLGKVLFRLALDGQPSHVAAEFAAQQDYDHVTVFLAGEQEAFDRSTLYGYRLKSNGFIYWDSFFLVAIWVGVLLMFRVLIIRKQDTAEGIQIEWTGGLKNVLFYGVVTFLVSLPLFTDFLADSHDLGFHLNRIEGMAEAFRSGQFPARINAVFNGGSGYPTEIMYPGLLLSIPALLRVCNVSLLLSFKIYCVLINLLTVVISDAAFSRVTASRKIGGLAAVLYTFALYRIDNLLCRGAIGEWTAMAFLPLLLWGLWEVFYGNEKRWPVLVLGITFVFQSHLISTLLCLMFCTLFGLAGIKKLKQASRAVSLGVAAVTTMLLNSFAIVPMLFFLKKGLSIAGQERMIGDYAAYLPQIFSNFIYNGNFAKGLGGVQGEMPVTIGCIFLLGSLLFLYMGFRKKRLEAYHSKAGTGLLLGGLLAVLLSSNLFPWNLLQSVPKVGRLFGMIQFPFRFLMLSVLCLAPVAAIGIYTCFKQNYEAVLAGAAAVCFVAALFHFDGYLEQNQTLMEDKYQTCIVERLGRDYLNYDYYDKETDWQAVVNMDPRVLSNDENGVITGFQKNGVTITLDYLQSGELQEVFLDLPLYYMDGYKAVEKNTKEQLKVVRGDGSRVRVFLPNTMEGSLKIEYAGLPLFWIFDGISVLTAVAGLGILFWRRKHFKHADKL